MPVFAMIIASMLGVQDSTVDAEQFNRLIKALHASFKDVSLIAEGRRSYVGPSGVYKNAPSEYERTYQAFFALRNDNSCFQDLYARSGDGDKLLVRTTSALFKGKLATVRSVPDLNKQKNSSRGGSISGFFNTGSPARIIFLWFFFALDDPSQFGYEFRGWEEIDGHHCLCVRLNMAASNPSAKINQDSEYYHLFWIDMARGGNVLKYEWKQGSRVHSRVDKVELRLVPAKDGRSLWLPIRGEYNTFYNGREFFDVPLLHETYAVVRGSVSLNSGLTDAQFSVDWNWINPTESKEMKSIRQHAIVLGPPPENLANDPASLKKRLDDTLSQADSQAERLEASSPARHVWSWTSVLQIGGIVIGLVLLGIAAWFRTRKT